MPKPKLDFEIEAKATVSKRVRPTPAVAETVADAKATVTKREAG